MKKIFIVTLLMLGINLPVYSEKAPQNEQESLLGTTQSYMDKGSKLWAENKLDLAEAAFQKAIKKDPKSAQAHARLAGLLLMQNKTAKAIPIYQSAISLDPENPKLFAALSIAYLHQAKFSMAKAMADEALRINPKMDQIKKINEYIDMKQKMLDEAKKNIPQHHPAPHGAVKHTEKEQENKTKEIK
jgi:tetratricopeptide (TPR) repeat protein